MDNSKKLTPEEMIEKYFPAQACEQYAAQETAEKDALLKEAVEKGQKLYNALMSIHLQFGDESHAFQMSNELYHWCDFMHTNNLNKTKIERDTPGKYGERGITF